MCIRDSLSTDNSYPSRSSVTKYRGAVSGFVLTSSAFFRCTELFLAQNYFVVKLVAFLFVALAAFSYYVISLLPAVDPILGLPKQMHEAAAFFLGLVVASSITSVARATLRRPAPVDD